MVNVKYIKLFWVSDQSVLVKGSQLGVFYP